MHPDNCREWLTWAGFSRWRCCYHTVSRHCVCVISTTQAVLLEQTVFWKKWLALTFDRSFLKQTGQVTDGQQAGPNSGGGVLRFCGSLCGLRILGRVKGELFRVSKQQKGVLIRQWLRSQPSLSIGLTGAETHEHLGKKKKKNQLCEFVIKDCCVCLRLGDGGRELYTK